MQTAQFLQTKGPGQSEHPYINFIKMLISYPSGENHHISACGDMELVVS